MTTTDESGEELTEKLQQLNLTAKPTGLEKAYDQLYTVVSYPLLYKDWINELGIECPKGVLLYGPPGVGKTFLVSTVAKACGADLFVIQGSDVVGSFIGESEQVLRQKFNEAQSAATHNHKPVLLFIDEIVGYPLLLLSLHPIHSVACIHFRMLLLPIVINQVPVTIEW